MVKGEMGAFVFLGKYSYRHRQQLPPFPVLCLILLIGIGTGTGAEGQRHHHHHHLPNRGHGTRPGGAGSFSFQNFDPTLTSGGSIRGGTDISARLALPPQLQAFHNTRTHIGSDSGAGSGSGFLEYQEQPRRNGEDGSQVGVGGVVPLYKQSYPGLYVKGHATRNYKYEPTTQVEHHHGPNYNAFQRGIGGAF